MKLISLYAAKNAERAYEIAMMELSSYENLFTAAQYFKGEGDDQTKSQYFEDLINQAHDYFIANETQVVTSDSEKFCSDDYILIMEWEVEFAKAFHDAGAKEQSTRSLMSASTSAKSIKDDLDRIDACCKVAKCASKIGEPAEAARLLKTAFKDYASKIKDKLKEFGAYCKIARSAHEIGCNAKVEPCLESAKLCKTNLSSNDLIHMHLKLANSSFSCKYFQAMDENLHEFLALSEKIDSIQRAYALDQFAALIKEIKASDEINSSFKTFDVEPYLKETLEKLDGETPSYEVLKAYLSIAAIYHQGVLVKKDSVQLEGILALTLSKIQSLSSNTAKEINNKIELLQKIIPFYKDDQGKALEALGCLLDIYQDYPANRPNDYKWDKTSLGVEIFNLYIECGQKKAANNFFKQHLLQSKDKEPMRRISKMVSLAKRCYGSSKNSDKMQMQAFLNSAEAFLPSIKSTIMYKIALRIIADGYLQVNRGKALQLLESEESRLARGYLTTAAVASIVFGAFYYSRLAGSLLMLGATVVQAARAL